MAKLFAVYVKNASFWKLCYLFWKLYYLSGHIRKWKVFFLQPFEVCVIVFVERNDCKSHLVVLTNLAFILTLFRLGFFVQSVTGGGGGRGGGLLAPPPLCISGKNNARVMKFTHNDHLRTKKPHIQFWLATPHDDVTVTSYSDFSMFLIIFPLRYVKYQ